MSVLRENEDDIRVNYTKNVSLRTSTAIFFLRAENDVRCGRTDTRLVTHLTFWY